MKWDNGYHEDSSPGGGGGIAKQLGSRINYM